MVTSTLPRVLVLAMAVVIPGMVEAGQVAPAHGIISGRVVDATGQPLPGVHVTARAGGAVVADVTSDQAGAYRLDATPGGTVDLRFSLIDFAVLTRRIQRGRRSETPGSM